MIRYTEQFYDGDERVFLIGPARDGRFLELVLIPANNPLQVIHADVLQPKHYRLLG